MTMEDAEQWFDRVVARLNEINSCQLSYCTLFLLLQQTDAFLQKGDVLCRKLTLTVSFLIYSYPKNQCAR
jgi:hypothetical protein